jgi:hypothetical protein
MQMFIRVKIWPPAARLSKQVAGDLVNEGGIIPNVGGATRIRIAAQAREVGAGAGAVIRTSLTRAGRAVGGRCKIAPSVTGRIFAPSRTINWRVL